eukprot:TRINITY_DN8871_c0_g3_i1.p1 TRINITY_DN8871_c0_g3~~TRINITY_DN8871_c0_g3_i1.p1  ORF type:complete len:779 (+),score=232.77 TRINITY_DN8871_c0_g3_i1:30-2366(+)
MLVTGYLVLYNLVLAAGWTWILAQVFASVGPCNKEHDIDVVPSFIPVFQNEFCFASSAGPAIFESLKVFQTAAILEVVHAFLGLVRAKASTTFWQVLSRVILTWCVCWIDPRVMGTLQFFTMSLAWSVTEVIRYNWYWTKAMFGDAPYPLTWCRYSFFYVLYPLGVSSELACIWKAISYLDELKAEKLMPAQPETSQFLDHVASSYNYIVMALILLYPMFFPVLFMHMVAQRKKTLGKKPAPRPQSNAGIQFPADSTGKRSTSAVGQAVMAMSVLQTDPSAAVACLKEKNWRFGYAKHFIKNVEVSLKNPETALKVAEDGLEYLHNTFEFGRDGKVMSLATAMETITDSFPGTMTIKGKAQRKQVYDVPYRRAPYPEVSDLENLVGGDLKKQLDKWVEQGTIEPSCRDAIAAVADNDKWVDLSDKYFVLLGAGSAMGPYLVLMALGANVIAIDLDRPNIWERLITIARESAGTLIFPTKKPVAELKDDAALFANAGGNLFTDTPEICNWLKELMPAEEFIVGGYAYLDGERHVRVSLAMDAIKAGVIAGRTTTTTLAYLCSPTDVFVVDSETRAAAKHNLKTTGGAVGVMASVMRVFMKKACTSNVLPEVTADNGDVFAINDGIVVQQGPNYALAKRLQHWRAMLARSQGSRVSSNIAPSTATASVVHNRSFAAAYGGWKYFPAYEVQFQETSNAVMGALLIHDVCNPASKVNVSYDLRNPLELFKIGSFHGGIWRCGYKVGSIGEAAAMLYYLSVYGPSVVLTVLGAAATAFALTAN